MEEAKLYLSFCLLKRYLESDELESAGLSFVPSPTWLHVASCQPQAPVPAELNSSSACMILVLDPFQGPWPMKLWLQDQTLSMKKKGNKGKGREGERKEWKRRRGECVEGEGS